MALDKTDIRNRLLDAAIELFLEDGYHGVSIRKLAQRANTNSSMINYYFNNKQGLFEEMIRHMYGRFEQAARTNLEPMEFSSFFSDIQNLYQKHPQMAQFFIQTMHLRSGPGSELMKDIFNNEKKIFQDNGILMKQQGKVAEHVDFEVLRIACICLTLLPAYLQDALRESYGDETYELFQSKFATFMGEALLNMIKADAPNPFGKERNKDIAAD